MSDTVTIRGKAPGEADFFYTLERVLGGLLAALKAGRIDEAIDVYTRCREDIGYQLISRAQGDAELFRQVANLFFRARDFARAAYCCEQLEEHDKAAQLYERCDDFAHAAQMYAAAGDRKKAAEMFEKEGNLTEAARLFRDLGEHARAAVCFERAGKLFDAATSFQAAGQLQRAIEALSKVDEDSPDRKVANKVIKELMGQANLQRSQTGQIALASVQQAAAAQQAAGQEVTRPVPAPISGLAIGGGHGDKEGGIVTLMEGMEFLRDLELFSELSLDELKSLYHLCTLGDVAAGAVVIRAGQPSDALYVVLSGALSVRTADGTEVAALGAGQHAGEMSLVDELHKGSAPATVDVVAARPSRLLRLERRGFASLLSSNDALAVRVYRVLLRVLSTRLRDTTARVRHA